MNIVESFCGMSINDADTAKRFYTETLGLALQNETMGLGFTLPGGGKLFLYEKPDHQPAGFTVLNFVISDIEAAVDELVGKGVVFERYDGMPGGQDERGIMRGKAVNMGPDIAWFKDPAGNIISVIEN